MVRQANTPSPAGHPNGDGYNAKFLIFLELSPMEPRPRLRRLVWKWLVPVVAIAALGIAAFAYLHTPQHRYRLTITAGSPSGTRHHLAGLLRDQVASRGLTLELHGCAGSEEALDWVNSGRLDCAFVQGGLNLGGRSNVRQVAMLHVEPLHLLVKKDLAAKVAARLAGLNGKTICIGEEGSGTHTLAVAVLAFAGLEPQAEGKSTGYLPRLVCPENLGTAGESDLPDAIFLVSSLPSSAVKRLVTQHGYQLVPLPFGEAFALEALAEDDGQRKAGHTVDKGRTYVAHIPPFTYGVDPPVPPEALVTLGNRLLVVANKDVDPQAIGHLVEALFETEFARIIRPPLDAKIMDLPPELPWHEGAERYRQRNRPMVSGDVLTLAQKSTATMAALLSGIVILWGWLRSRRHAKKAHRFRYLLNEVTRLDEEAMHREESGEVTVDKLLSLRGQLGQLRSSALDQFTEGELDDNELMASFLAHVNSSRDNLTRLIAQHRYMASQSRSAAYSPLTSLYGPGAEPDETPGLPRGTGAG